MFTGMTLGGTWGFVLDNLFGTDEGFREYLWDPAGGMRYAMGTLATERFGRYIVTILFDMFFTVILFKKLFTKLVLVAGFTVRGREWIANGFVSAFIGLLTFKVCAFPRPSQPLRAQTLVPPSTKRSSRCARTLVPPPTNPPGTTSPLLLPSRYRTPSHQATKPPSTTSPLLLPSRCRTPGVRQHDSLRVGVPIGPRGRHEPMDLGADDGVRHGDHEYGLPDRGDAHSRRRARVPTNPGMPTPTPHRGPTMTPHRSPTLQASQGSTTPTSSSS